MIEHKNEGGEGGSGLREKGLHFRLGGSPCPCTGSCLSSFQHQGYLAKCPLSYLPNPRGSSLLGHRFSKERAQAEGTDRRVVGMHEGQRRGKNQGNQDSPNTRDTQANASCRNCYAPATEAATATVQGTRPVQSPASQGTSPAPAKMSSRLGHYSLVPCAGAGHGEEGGSRSCQSPPL